MELTESVIMLMIIQMLYVLEMWLMMHTYLIGTNGRE